MTRFLVYFTLVVFLLSGAGIVLAQDEQAGGYEKASQMLQEAMTCRLEAQRIALEAVHKYEMALTELENFKAIHPDWNPELVSQRIADCKQILSKLSGEEASPQAPSAAAAPVTVAAPVSAAPADASAPFIGHANSKKLHLASCQWAQKMSVRNRVYFQGYADAVAAGYIPCKVCKPDLMAGVPVAIAPAAVAQEPAAPADVSAPFIGHANSKKLHLASCQWAQKMSARNRVYFQGYADAVAAGYIPCKVCKPDQAAALQSVVAPAAVGQVAPLPAAPGAEESEYWASGKGKTFHRPSCEWAKKISSANLVKYQSRADAVAAGLNPCKVCHP